MRVSKTRALLLVALALWLQLGPISFLRWDGVAPPLVASVVTLLATALGHRGALAYGVVAGALEDAASGRALGLHVLLYLALVGFASFTSRRLYTEEPWLLVPIIAGCLFVERLLAGTFLNLVGVPEADVVLQAGLGAAMAVPVVLLGRWFLGARVAERR